MGNILSDERYVHKNGVWRVVLYFQSRCSVYKYVQVSVILTIFLIINDSELSFLLYVFIACVRMPDLA